MSAVLQATTLKQGMDETAVPIYLFGEQIDELESMIKVFDEKLDDSRNHSTLALATAKQAYLLNDDIKHSKVWGKVATAKAYINQTEASVKESKELFEKTQNALVESKEATSELGKCNAVFYAFQTDTTE